MAFSDLIARDSEFIHNRAAAEFAVQIKFWADGLDPDTATPTDIVYGTRLEQAHDRMEDSDGQAEMHGVIATVTKASVASIDEQGKMSVDGVIYSIQSVSGADSVTWRVSGERSESYELGDASRHFGG